MRDVVLAIPDHLRDAVWRVETAQLAPQETAGLLVCGMGGSAIGGDLAAAMLGDRLTRPMMIVRSYELPSWATPEWTVLCSSHSGDTEETLACFAAAEALGARRIVASTGGALVDQARRADVPIVGLPGLLPAPRTAVAYMLVVAAEIFFIVCVSTVIYTEIDAAAAFLSERSAELEARAREIGTALAGSFPVLHGADLTAAVARRWKTQINENAKTAAFFSELPEADHNELCAWRPGDEGHGRLSAVMLEDSDQHPRERQRFELTARAIEASGAQVVRVETAGETRIERLLWAVMLGDLVSLELAEAAAVDPLPVEALEALKRSLAGS